MESNKEQSEVNEEDYHSELLDPVPIMSKDLPDELFMEGNLAKELEEHIIVFMSHFFLNYIDSNVDVPIQMPTGIDHERRMIIHHICDKLGLGSLVRGTKGLNKRVIVAPMKVSREKFIKAKYQRGIILANSVKNYRFRSYNSPEMQLQEDVHKLAAEQIENHKNGLDYQKSWKEHVTKGDKEAEEYLNKLSKEKQEKENPPPPDDGRDYSVSYEGFQCYIKSENKTVLNSSYAKEEPSEKDKDVTMQSQERDPNPENEDIDFDDIKNVEDKVKKDINQMIMENFIEVDQQKEVGAYSDNQEVEKYVKDGNYSEALKEFKGVPNKITEIRITEISANTVSLEWEIPD